MSFFARNARKTLAATPLFSCLSRFGALRTQAMSSTNTFHNLTSLRTFSASTYAPASLGFMAASASAFTASTFFNNNVSLCEPSTVEVVVPTDDINVEDFDGVDFDELEKEVNGLGSTAAKATGEDEFEGRDKSFPLFFCGGLLVAIAFMYRNASGKNQTVSMRLMESRVMAQSLVLCSLVATVLFMDTRRDYQKEGDK